MANDLDGGYYRDLDGSAYTYVNGQKVSVSQDKLMVGGSYDAPEDNIIGGVTYRYQQGKFYRVNGNNLIPITDQNQISNLQKQYSQEQSNKNNGLIVGGVVIVVLLWFLKG